jgi:hypothetical protein
LAWLIVGTAGCSVDVDNLFGNDGAGGSGAGGAGSQQASNATSDVATSTTDGATTGPTTTVTTGGQTTATTGSTTATTGTGMTGPTVFCNGSECDPNQVCCFNRFTEGVDFCSAAGTCPDGGEWTEITCNGPADCSSGHCCGTYDPNQGWVKVECAQNCGGNSLDMCFGDPTVCAQGDTCMQSQTLGDGYMFCTGN